ncbi:hypothetical protein MBGDC06_00443 [Thermoplasmatales archaeon SCGC AB-539-C06]|nr:hypothetical protein MBGDC06_00443 [Thermoplasmatales archaeon SCGC AB-539-C06]
MRKIAEICEKHNGTDIEMSYDAKERQRLFGGRKKKTVCLVIKV